MGIYKELQKHFGSSVQNYIAAARTVQGYEDWKTADQVERLEVIRLWREIQPEIAAEKEHHTFHSPRSLLKHGRKSSFDNAKKKSDKGRSFCKRDKDRHNAGPPTIHRNTSVDSTITTSSVESAPDFIIVPPVDSPDDIAFEEAMKASEGFFLPGERETKTVDQQPRKEAL